jgi:hypothetical protein
MADDRDVSRCLGTREGRTNADNPVTTSRSPRDVRGCSRRSKSEGECEPHAEKVAAQRVRHSTFALQAASHSAAPSTDPRARGARKSQMLLGRPRLAPRAPSARIVRGRGRQGSRRQASGVRRQASGGGPGVTPQRPTPLTPGCTGRARVLLSAPVSRSRRWESGSPSHRQRPPIEVPSTTADHADGPR